MTSSLGLPEESAVAVEKSAELSSASGETAPAPHPTLRSLRAEAEVHAISRALQETGWNRKRAAEILKISYRGLLYKIQQHKITPEFTEHLAK